MGNLEKARVSARSMSNFSNELSRFVDPRPVFHDPEDDQDEVTIAKLTDREKDTGDEVSGSLLRRKLAVLSTKEEKKYAGRKTSRSKLQQQQWIMGKQNKKKKDDDKEKDIDSEDNETSIDKDLLEESPDTDDLDEEDESVDEDDVADLMSFKSKMSKAALDRSHDSDEDVDDEFEDDSHIADSKILNDDDDEDASRNEMEEDNDNDDDEDDISHNENEDDNDEDEEEDSEDEDNSDEEGGISSFSHTDVHGEVQKGLAAKQQLGLWDSLLEGRIRFQKTISLVNQLPQPDTWKELVNEGEQPSQQLMTVQSQLTDLLDKLIQLQTLLLLQHNETKHIVTGDKAQSNSTENEDDEEITSESEDDEKEDDKMKQSRDDKLQNSERGIKRKISFEEIPDVITKRHSAYTIYRNDTIQKWYDKTRLSSGKVKSKSFGSFEMSTLKQIEQILSDKERLIKRTQMRRSNYHVIGKNEEAPVSTTDSTEAANMEPHSYDSEIFDDSDFYHQQLRELIERRTSNISDPIALSRQWLEIQKLRNKVKKKVDTKASKGRKVRYNVHKKLVNFMAPRETCTWSDTARDDLFKSLFGERPKFMSMDDR